MVINDTLDLVKEYAVDFIDRFLLIIALPWADDKQKHKSKNNRLYDEKAINIKVLIYIILSTVSGASISSLILERTEMLPLISIIITITLIWLLFGVVEYLVCKRLKGKGTLNQTVSIVMSIVSSGYLVSGIITYLFSVLNFVWGHFLQYNLNIFQLGIIDISIQVVFVLIYLPNAIGKIHGFKLVKSYLVGLFASGLMSIIGFPLFVVGGC